MYFDRKATSRYLKRRHKLYKALNNLVHGPSPISVTQPENISSDPYQLDEARKTFTQVFDLFLHQNLDIFNTLETLKTHKKILFHFNQQLLENLILATQFQSGHKLAYITYRYCRQNPDQFRTIVKILENILLKKNDQQQTLGIQLCIFYTDLFFYGFYFTAKTYLEKVFCNCQKFIIDFIMKLPPVHEWEIFMSKRHVFKLKSSSQNWMNQLIRKTKFQFEKIQALADQIQSNIVLNKTVDPSNQIQKTEKNYPTQNMQKQYQILFEEYEAIRQKLEYLERDEGIRTARSLQQVKAQCEHYEPSFKLPQLLHNLYKQRKIPQMQIKRIKKSQMISIFEDEAFLTQLRICGSVQKAIDLSSYFIANLSTESNLENLIEYIIDQCHHESSLDLIMKIVAQINCEYPEISQHLNKKAHKIASNFFFIKGQIKMNKKYLNLLCEGIKYGMIDSSIMLEYVQKRILTEHTEMSIFEIIRESCNILELLGQGVYHESLKTNIFVNKLFAMIEQKIKEKKLGIEFTFNLKCVKNYLRKANYLPELIQNSPQILENQTLTELTEEFNLQQHFDLILKRIKELLINKANNKTEEAYNKKRIINYVVSSIQNKSSFIQTFYEASLVKEINHKEIKEQIIEKCIERIQSSVGSNIQQALKWSRFLGELYNYEILNRKKLAEILESKMLYCSELCSVQNMQKMVKCVIECLSISKGYILESQISKETNQYIVNFLLKLKRSVLKHLSIKQGPCRGIFENVMTEQELQQILSYFHPALLEKFKTVEEIDLWSQKVKFSSTKDTLLSVNIYKMLQYYLQVQQVLQFDPTMIDGPGKKHKTHKQVNGKKANKKIIYKEKEKANVIIDTKQNSQQIKSGLSKIQQIEKQIEQINENFRNQETEELPEEEKQLIMQEEQNLDKSLKEMMGITPQIEIDEKFPSLNQSNLKPTKITETAIENKGGNSFRKIIKNPQGKKIKLITRKIHSEK